MNRPLNNHVNKRLLFRLVQFFMNIERRAKENPGSINSSQLNKLTKGLRSDIGHDIAFYVIKNIMIFPEGKDIVYPKFQFEHNEIKFSFILN